MTLLAGASRLSLNSLPSHQSVAQLDAGLAQAIAPAELQLDALLIGDSTALQPVLLRSAHRHWGIWSKALQRTRQLLWMFTRHQTLRQGAQLA